MLRCVDCLSARRHWCTLLCEVLLIFEAGNTDEIPLYRRGLTGIEGSFFIHSFSTATGTMQHTNSKQNDNQDSNQEPSSFDVTSPNTTPPSDCTSTVMNLGCTFLPTHLYSLQVHGMGLCNVNIIKGSALSWAMTFYWLRPSSFNCVSLTRWFRYPNRCRVTPLSCPTVSKCGLFDSNFMILSQKRVRIDLYVGRLKPWNFY